MATFISRALIGSETYLDDFGWLGLVLAVLDDRDVTLDERQLMSALLDEIRQRLRVTHVAAPHRVAV